MMTPSNKKPRKLLDQASGAGGSAPRLSAKKFSPKSTTTEAQRQRVLEALRAGPKTSHDLRRLGIYQAPARIKELRDRHGYSITTDPVVIVDRDGYHHARVALYTLMSEPAEASIASRAPALR